VKLLLSFLGHLRWHDASFQQIQEARSICEMKSYFKHAQSLMTRRQLTRAVRIAIARTYGELRLSQVQQNFLDNWLSFLELSLMTRQMVSGSHTNVATPLPFVRCHMKWKKSRLLILQNGGK
jgi:hypothetical protein